MEFRKTLFPIQNIFFGRCPNAKIFLLSHSSVSNWLASFQCLFFFPLQIIFFLCVLFCQYFLIFFHILLKWWFLYCVDPHFCPFQKPNYILFSISRLFPVPNCVLFSIHLLFPFLLTTHKKNTLSTSRSACMGSALSKYGLSVGDEATYCSYTLVLFNTDCSHHRFWNREDQWLLDKDRCPKNAKPTVQNLNKTMKEVWLMVD